MKKVVVAALLVLAVGLIGSSVAFSEEAPSTKTYTVEPGDNLHWISTIFFDHARAWEKIWEANREIIPDPNLIHPGQVLVIPQD